MATALPAAALPSKVRPRQADVLPLIPRECGDQASAKGEDFGRTVIGTVRAPAEEEIVSQEARSGSCWQSRLFSRRHTLSGRPAHRQAHVCVGLTILAAAAAVATTRSGMTSFGGDGHFRRHQSALHERQTHPKRQQERQEERADPIAKLAAHSGAKMATLGRLSKTFENQGRDSEHFRSSRATGHAVERAPRLVLRLAHELTASFKSPERTIGAHQVSPTRPELP